MKINAIQDFLLVEVLLKQDEHRTHSGIYIPKGADANSVMLGRVVNTGPGKMLPNGNMHDMDIKVGEIVLYETSGPKTLVEFASIKDGDGHALPKQFLIRRDFILATVVIEEGDQMPIAVTSAGDAPKMQLIQ